MALGMAQRAKSQMPGVDSITDTLGWVFYKRGNYENAKPLFEECVHNSPNTASFVYHLGLNQIALGQPDLGKKHIEAALGLKLDGQDAKQAREKLSQL